MSSAPTKVCQQCRARIDAAASTCPNCGARIAVKDPRVAAVVSLVLPGLGQIYNRQIPKAIVFIILGIIGLYLITSPENRSDFRFGLLIYPIFLAYNVYDAYHVATEINEAAF